MSTKAAPRLSVQGIAKSYGAVRALTNVDLEALAGTVHAVLGENGAGKSTLVRVLAGLVQRDSGDLLLDGERIQFRTPRKAEAAGVGIAFQESSLVGHLTVAESLVLGSQDDEPKFKRTQRLEAAARELLEKYDAPNVDVRARVNTLPLAQRQIVEVVKAANRGSSVLVLDEANSALSGASNEWFLRTARTAAADGAAVLFVSHRLAEIRAIANIVTVLRGGASIGRFDPAGTTDDALVEAMVGHRARTMERAMSRDSTFGAEIVLSAVAMIPAGSPGNGVSFDLRAGEVVGLAGLDDNGQAEVIQAIAGVLPHHGALTLHGMEFAPKTPRDAIRHGIGYVPADRQREGLLPTWSIMSNLSLSVIDSFSSRLGFLNSKTETTRAVQMAKRMGLPEERIGSGVDTLSGGNQQRVVLGKVLSTNPSILLLFDGTRGVDVVTRASILKEIRDIAERGTAVLFYSSDMSEYVSVADRVLVMSHGAIIGSVLGSDVSEEAILQVVVSSTSNPIDQIQATDSA
jgi:ribose transport system ATP-binding protein